MKKAKQPKPKNRGARPVQKTGQAKLERNRRLLNREHPGTMADKKKADADKEKYHQLKAIYEGEGIDAALNVARKIGFTQYEAFNLIEMWRFPKEYARRKALEELGYVMLPES